MQDRFWLEADRRPEGVDDDTVEAVGKLSEAVECIERARGALYDFHQLSGHADLLVGEAVEMLREAGQGELAGLIDRELVGRNVIEGRWSFQIVEEYDETYWSVARELRRRARDELTGGRPHVHESEMKERRRTDGHPRHTNRPAPGA